MPPVDGSVEPLLLAMLMLAIPVATSPVPALPPAVTLSSVNASAGVEFQD